tara:strand:+ start:37 stop:219 length:183 start_codon:yes stop_codon:yes gene_type:complete
MKPIEELLYRVQTLDDKVKRIQSDLECIKKDNARLYKEKEKLQETIKEKEKEKISSGWFW